MKTKNLILLLIAFISTISCNREEENITDNKLIGEWKLVQGKQNFNEVLTIDYSSQNIIYNFQSNNTLNVSGGDNIGYNNGNYPYEFKHDFISTDASGGNKKMDLIEIQNSRWIFNSSGSKMTLDLSYHDGPTLTLEKK